MIPTQNRSVLKVQLGHKRYKPAFRLLLSLLAPHARNLRSLILLQKTSTVSLSSEHVRCLSDDVTRSRVSSGLAYLRGIKIRDSGYQGLTVTARVVRSKTHLEYIVKRF